MPRLMQNLRKSKRKCALAIESHAGIEGAIDGALPAVNKTTAMSQIEATPLTLKDQQVRLLTRRKREGRARGNQRDRAAIGISPQKARREAT